MKVLKEVNIKEMYHQKISDDSQTYQAVATEKNDESCKGTDCVSLPALL